MNRPFGIAIVAALTSLVLMGSAAFGVENELARILLSLSLFMFLGILGTALAERGERFFSLSVSLFFIAALIVPAMMHCAQGWFPFFSKSYPEALVTRAAAVMALFSVTVAIGYALSYRRATPAQTGPKFTISPGPALMLSATFAAVALLIFAASPSDFLAKRGDLMFATWNPTPFKVAITALARNAGFLSFLLTLLCAVKARSVPAWTMMPFTFAVAALVNNPVNVPRFPLIALMLTTLFLLFRTDTRRFKWTFSGSYIFGLLTLFPFLSQIARGGRGATLFQRVSEYYSKTGDFDGLQSIVNIVNWVDGAGLQWGRQLLSVLLVFVPREFWPTKAVGTGGAAAAYAGYPFVNISAPLPGEIYADFGLIGVTAAGLACGWLVPRLDQITEQSFGRLGPQVALATLAGYSAIICRGSLLGVVAPSILAVMLASLLGLVGEQRWDQSTQNSHRRWQPSRRSSKWTRAW